MTVEWLLTQDDHILKESASPPERMVWTMWCGEQCVAQEDGTLVPALDFYLEKEAALATCEGCRSAMKTSERLLEEATS